MRIRLRSRRGSIGLEAVMIVPVAVMMILVARFVSEAMVSRQETAVYIRAATVNAAAVAGGYTGGLATAQMVRNCRSDRAPFSDQADVSQGQFAYCLWRNAEEGVTERNRFWRRVEEGARPWPDIIRDYKPANPSRSERDVTGRIQSTMQFQRPDFLQRQGGTAVQHQYLVPTTRVWDHKKRPLKQASDRVIYRELRSNGKTHKLFPNVFPSRNN